MKEHTKIYKQQNQSDRIHTKPFYHTLAKNQEFWP